MRDATPLADGPARVTAVAPTGLTLRFARPGRSLVRARYTPFWRDRDLCVRKAPGDWTEVTSARAGTVRLSATDPLGVVRSPGSMCSPR